MILKRTKLDRNKHNIVSLIMKHKHTRVKVFNYLMQYLKRIPVISKLYYSKKLRIKLDKNELTRIRQERTEKASRCREREELFTKKFRTLT